MVRVTRLNMLFIPSLPVKVEFTAMLIMLSTNTKNARQGLGWLGRGPRDYLDISLLDIFGKFFPIRNFKK